MKTDLVIVNILIILKFSLLLADREKNRIFGGEATRDVVKTHFKPRDAIIAQKSKAK